MKKSGRIGLRVAPEDKEVWERLAAQQGRTLSAWIEYWIKVGVDLTKEIDESRRV